MQASILCGNIQRRARTWMLLMPLLVSFLQPRRLRVSRRVSAWMDVMPLLVMLLQSCSAMNLSLVILAMLSIPLQDKQEGGRQLC